MAEHSIISSVGTGGTNRRPDVLIVQRLLNERLNTGLKEDGIAGVHTTTAIIEYQKGFLTNPDGRIDPNGTTWKKLSGEDQPQRRLILLPQESGNGYYSYDAPETQYGTENTISAMIDVGRQLIQTNPQFMFGIGHISYAKGGHMKPHKTHQKGTDVDIRPIRNDNSKAPVTIYDTKYSREQTRVLIDVLLSHSNIKMILFNDKEISGVRYFDGHHNHLHVSFQS